jgi:hypothetical protein
MMNLNHPNTATPSQQFYHQNHPEPIYHQIQHTAVNLEHILFNSQFQEGGMLLAQHQQQPQAIFQMAAGLW